MTPCVLIGCIGQPGYVVTDFDGAPQSDRLHMTAGQIVTDFDDASLIGCIALSSIG